MQRRNARSDEEKKFATQRLRNDVMKHVNDIAEKYLITGETQDTALMFVPSAFTPPISEVSGDCSGFAPIVTNCFTVALM